MLKIDYLPIDKLQPYENNAKIHTDEQIEQIKNSIKEFGMLDPIGIWGGQNKIVEGHGRLLACKQLGIKEVPIIRLDELTDEQRKAYTLIHNKTTMNTGYDENILAIELTDLEDFELDLGDFGFDDLVLDDFGTDFELPSGDKSEICQMTFTLHEKQKELIEYAISTIGDNVSEKFSNTNKNGNALYEVVKQWAEQKK